MAWFYLLVAGILEIGWATLLKQSYGFTRLWPSVGAAVFMVASLGLLSLSLRTLPLGTAYLIWTGIGAIGSFAVGIIVFGEPATALRLLAAALVTSGLVLMKVAS